MKLRWVAIMSLLAACSRAAPRSSVAPVRSAPARSAPVRSPEPVPFGDNASFAIDKAALRAKGVSAKLVDKLQKSAFRYFRMLGREFASRTCWSFRDVRAHLPVVAVHGDAHVEQFVVTEHTYGLEDFDQAGFGPAVVDLVRYAASLHMACREVSWSCRAEDAVATYFRSYREALDKPPPPAALPRIVDRLRSKGPQAKEKWLEWTDSLMRPLTAADDAQYRKGWAQFTKLQTEVQPERPASFYDIVRFGGLEMGVGSALESKLLFRIRGATDAPSDDLVLEARSPSPATGREAVWRPRHGGALHVLMFTAILGRRMPEIHGYVPLDERECWVQSWDPGYREVSISDIESQLDLEELATDAARQLAGHFWAKFPEPIRAEQRFAQLRAFDLVDTRARRLARELAAEVVTEWERFRR